MGTIIKWVGSSVEIEEQRNLVIELEKERDLRERFVTALTHDLRSPLTAAKLNAQILRKKMGDSLAVQKLATNIITSIDRGENMIRDRLDANSLKAGEKIPIVAVVCRLDAVAMATALELNALTSRSVVVENQYGPIQGYWDGDGLRRVIENLISNAVKYGARDAPITIRFLKLSEAVELSIHNVGNPIPAEDQSALFESYHRSPSAKKSGQKGWGIGLTVVKGITDAHGGHVRVESSTGGGTTFTVQIPMDSRPHD